MTSPRSRVPQPNVGRGRQVIAGLVTSAVLAIVFLRVLPRIADYGAAWMVIRRMSFAGLMALVLAIAVNIALFAWPLRVVLPGLSFTTAFVARQTSFVISNTVPAGGALSLAVQYGVLADAGVTAPAATAAITLTGLWNLAITLVLPALGAGVVLITGRMASEWLVVAGLSIAGVVALAVAVFALLRDATTAQRAGRRIDRLAGRMPRVVRNPDRLALGDRLVEMRAATVAVLTTRRLPLTISTLSLHVMQFTILFVALRSLHGPASAPVGSAEVFAAFAFVRLATFVPLTPNGLGTVDAGLAGLLIAFGVAGDEALAAVLVWRVATTLPQIAVGAGTFLYWRRTR